MPRVVPIPVDDVVPPAGAVLQAQGVPPWARPDGRVEQLALEALNIYREKARPRGLLEEITRDGFRSIIQGADCSDDESPVHVISQRSDNLALFAATIGEDVSVEISKAFDRSDFALASMLDAAASEGAELAARMVEDIYRRDLKGDGRSGGRLATLRFSPGYCGWRMTGQKRLFPALQPGAIGITLNESCLMRPIKSISGVIISGRKEIFEFEDVFSFCRDCATHTCRERARVLQDE